MSSIDRLISEEPLLEGADETLFLPTDELVAESVGDLTYYQPNDAKPTKRKRRRRQRFLAEEALDLYDGHEGFLVRTAVIRSRDWDESKAPRIREPGAAAKLANHLKFADQEHMIVLALDGRSRLIAIHETAIGGTSSVQMQAKHMVKVPLLVSASSVIILHNHPSGACKLSSDDYATSRVLYEAFKCVGIPLLDSVVVAHDGWSSYLQEKGSFE